MLKSQNTFIFIYVVFIYQYWGALKMIFDKKKSNNYIINCRQCAKIFIKSCNFMTFIHLLSTYYYNTKGEKIIKN